MSPLTAVALDFLLAALASVGLALAVMGLWVSVNRLIGLAMRLGNRGGHAPDLRPRVGHARRVYPEGTE